MKPLILSILFFATATVAQAETHQVKIKSLSYDPKQIEIKKGDSVEWVNTALTQHSATADVPGTDFDTGLVKPGKTSKKIAFQNSGTFGYHCSIHGKTMSAQVTVKP